MNNAPIPLFYLKVHLILFLIPSVLRATQGVFFLTSLYTRLLPMPHIEILTTLSPLWSEFCFLHDENYLIPINVFISQGMSILEIFSFHVLTSVITAHIKRFFGEGEDI